MAGQVLSEVVLLARKLAAWINQLRYLPSLENTLTH